MPTPGGNFAESWILRLRHVTGVFWLSGQVHRHLGICLAHQVEWEVSHARTQLFRLFSAGWTWSIVSALLSFSNALGCTGIYANRKEKTRQCNYSDCALDGTVLFCDIIRTESRLGLDSLGSCGWLHPSPGFWDYRSELPNLSHEASDTVPPKLHPLSQPQESYRFCEERLHGSPTWRGWGVGEMRG